MDRDEAFYGLSGEVLVELEGAADLLHLGRGGFLFAPRNRRHAYRNTGPVAAHLLVFAGHRPRARDPPGRVGRLCRGAARVALNGEELFFAHVRLHGGPAPVRRFLPELIELVWNRRSILARFSILPCRSIAWPKGYKAMDERRAKGAPASIGPTLPGEARPPCRPAAR